MQITAKFKILLPSLLIFVACVEKEKGNIEQETLKDSIEIEDWKTSGRDLTDLYNVNVTIIRKPDTIMTISHQFDTTIIETGIFSYLQFDFPRLSMLDRFTDISRMAIEAENSGDTVRSRELHDSSIYFYHNQRLIDKEFFSDLQSNHMYNSSASILCSYAYERTGDLDSAIEVLKPHMTTNHSRYSRIHLRFFQLCEKKYGPEKVKDQIVNAYRTLNSKDSKLSELASHDKWRVKILGANIGIPASHKPTKVEIDNLFKSLVELYSEKSTVSTEN
jgi:hypothetical protein